MDPLEAFGEAGTYPRTTVARLYTGTRAQVVRFPIERNGRTVAAVTLISPYPDPTLSRLEPGTLAIILHVDRLAGSRQPVTDPVGDGQSPGCSSASASIASRALTGF